MIIKIVKCIDNADVATRFSINKIYKMIKDYDYYYLSKRDFEKQIGWYHRRFKELDNTSDKIVKVLYDI